MKHPNAIIQPTPFQKTDKAHYTYAALVTKVVDGDTLWAAADLGFGVKHRLKLRLRGINTAELGILSRGEAKRYVEKRTLGKQVVIRTYQEDKYGRYLADIYYLKGKEKEGTKKGEETDPHKIAEKGNFLNQELLDEELAEVYI